MTILQIDELIAQTLTTLAADMLDSKWCGKEHEWVNLFVFNYLLRRCGPEGPLQEPGQIGIEVHVGQPPEYGNVAVRRNIVIWPRSRMSCFGEDWTPRDHPSAILEWKVNRVVRNSQKEPREWEWLRNYTRWQPKSVAYAIDVDIGCSPSTLSCRRFHSGNEQADWQQFKGLVVKLCERCGLTAAKKGEKYCTECRTLVMAEMNEGGYLQTSPQGHFGQARPSDARENTHETKHGTGHG